MYLLVEVGLEVCGQTIGVEAAVSETLLVAVLLGADVPDLTQMLGGGVEEASFLENMWCRDRMLESKIGVLSVPCLSTLHTTKLIFRQVQDLTYGQSQKNPKTTRWPHCTRTIKVWRITQCLRNYYMSIGIQGMNTA